MAQRSPLGLDPFTALVGAKSPGGEKKAQASGKKPTAKLKKKGTIGPVSKRVGPAGAKKKSKAVKAKKKQIPAVVIENVVTQDQVVVSASPTKKQKKVSSRKAPKKKSLDVSPLVGTGKKARGEKTAMPETKPKSHKSESNQKENLTRAVAEGLRASSIPRREKEELKISLDVYRRQWEGLMDRVNQIPVPDHKKQVRDDMLAKMAGVREFFMPQRYLDFWFDFVLASRSEEIDPFGLDPKFEERVEGLLSFMYNSWWRVQVKGVENIPDDGRVLLVSNHSGVLPWDGAMIKLAVKQEHEKKRRVRFLIENFVFYFPFLGPFMTRFGSVRASQDNARRLLDREEVVAVFPEGVKGLGKLYRQRYQLQRFGRGGFVRLAESTHSPIVPVAVIGAEEIHPVIGKADVLARQLGMPYFPITLSFPALGLFGLIPLPTRWTIRFGEPYHIKRGKNESEDIWVNTTSLTVRKQIQELIYEELRLRGSVFLG